MSSTSTSATPMPKRRPAHPAPTRRRMITPRAARAQLMSQWTRRMYRAPSTPTRGRTRRAPIMTSPASCYANTTTSSTTTRINRSPSRTPRRTLTPTPQPPLLLLLILLRRHRLPLMSLSLYRFSGDIEDDFVGAGWWTERHGGTGVVRIEVEEVVGLRAYEVVG